MLIFWTGDITFRLHRVLTRSCPKYLGPNVFKTPITSMGCRQCLPLSVVQLKGKHCRKLHCRNGVVDTFGQLLITELISISKTFHVKDCYFKNGELNHFDLFWDSDIFWQFIIACCTFSLLFFHSFEKLEES